MFVGTRKVGTYHIKPLVSISPAFSSLFSFLTTPPLLSTIPPSYHLITEPLAVKVLAPLCGRNQAKTPTSNPKPQHQYNIPIPHIHV